MRCCSINLLNTKVLQDQLKVEKSSCKYLTTWTQLRITQIVNLIKIIVQNCLSMQSIESNFTELNENNIQFLLSYKLTFLRKISPNDKTKGLHLVNLILRGSDEVRNKLFPLISPGVRYELFPSISPALPAYFSQCNVEQLKEFWNEFRQSHRQDGQRSSENLSSLENMVRGRVKELDLSTGFQAWKHFPELNCLSFYTFEEVQSYLYFNENELCLLAPTVCCKYMKKYHSTEYYFSCVERALRDNSSRKDLFFGHNALKVIKETNLNPYEREKLQKLLTTRKPHPITGDPISLPEYFRARNLNEFADEIEPWVSLSDEHRMALFQYSCLYDE